MNPQSQGRRLVAMALIAGVLLIAGLALGFAASFPLFGGVYLLSNVLTMLVPRSVVPTGIFDVIGAFPSRHAS